MELKANILGCDKDNYDFLKKRYRSLFQPEVGMTDIDEEMRYMIYRINQHFPFIIPVWSCASHPENHDFGGYLAFVTPEQLTVAEYDQYRRILINAQQSRLISVQPKRLFSLIPNKSKGKGFYQAVIFRSKQATTKLELTDKILKKLNRSKAEWLFNLYRVFDKQ